MITTVFCIWALGAVFAWPSMVSLARVQRFRGHDIGKEDLSWIHIVAGLFVALFWPIALSVRIFSKLFQ